MLKKYIPVTFVYDPSLVIENMFPGLAPLRSPLVVFRLMYASCVDDIMFTGLFTCSFFRFGTPLIVPWKSSVSPGFTRSVNFPLFAGSK